MLVTITDFALERGQDRDTVNAWIRNHPEINESCIRQGRDKLIDKESEAFKKLDKQYPVQILPVIEDKESMAELIRTQKQLNAAKDMIIELEKQLGNVKVQLIEAEKTTLLIETTKKAEVDSLTKDIEVMKSQHNEAVTKLKEHYNSEIDNLQAQIRAEQNRKLTLLERITGRKSTT